MLVLALDTATENGSLALAEDDRLLAEYTLHSPGTYLQRLLPAVEELLLAAFLVRALAPMVHQLSQVNG